MCVRAKLRGSAERRLGLIGLPLNSRGMQTCLSVYNYMHVSGHFYFFKHSLLCETTHPPLHKRG